MLIIYGCVLGAFVFFYMSGAIVISVEDVKKEVDAALLDTLERYEPDSVTDNDQKIVEAWNSVMEEVRKGNPRCFGKKNIGFIFSSLAAELTAMRTGRTTTTTTKHGEDPGYVELRSSVLHNNFFLF